MAKLSDAEMQLMEVIWRRGPLFLKELIEELPEPKPAATTAATLLKRMQDKGFVGYETFGNSRRYHSLVPKDEHFAEHLGGLVKNFFGDSALRFASFFTQSARLSKKELEQLRALIDSEIQKKKK